MPNREPRLKMKNVDDKKKTSHVTMMVIPHSHGANTKNFCIPIWLLRASLGLSVLCVLVVMYFVTGFFYLKYVTVENAELKQINTAQATEIYDLKDMAGTMRGKLDALIKLDSEVRAKVGLTKDAQADKAVRSNENMEISRMNARYQFMTMGLGTAPGTTSETVHIGLEAGILYGQEDVFELSVPGNEPDTLEELKEQLAAMDSVLTEQADALNKLNSDVDKQLALERAIPNAWPLQGRLTSNFGWRKNPTAPSQQQYHTGIDIANSYGTPIRAAAYGTVTFAGSQSGWGRVILISHGYGYVSQYAHNSQLLVKKGDKIERGQIIARLGSTGRSTGPHLHFGVAKDGKWIDPLSLLKR